MDTVALSKQIIKTYIDTLNYRDFLKTLTQDQLDAQKMFIDLRNNELKFIKKNYEELKKSIDDQEVHDTIKKLEEVNKLLSL